MGTQSNVRIFDGQSVLLCIYRHCDGYPSGMGQDIKDFVKDGKIVNGISGDQWCFNGIDCFAAGLVAYLKTDKETKCINPGNVYIFPANHEPFSAGEDYLYDIREKDGRLYVDVKVCNNERIILSGYVDEIDFKD